jgi:hypothetical protein
MTAIKIGAAAAILLVSSSPASAQMQQNVLIGATYNSLSNPIWRKASGYEEVTLGQSRNVIGLRGGWQITGPKWGFGTELSGTRASFDNFRVPRSIELSMPPGMSADTGSTSYSSPSYTVGQLDLLVHWLPATGQRASVYGVLGMGFRTQSYQIANAAFAEWNGAKDITEFTYSYGLGGRFGIRHVALVAEYRLFPGDITHECTDLGEFLYSSGPFDVYRCNKGKSWTSNHMKLASIGLLLSTR